MPNGRGRWICRVIVVTMNATIESDASINNTWRTRFVTMLPTMTAQPTSGTNQNVPNSLIHTIVGVSQLRRLEMIGSIRARSCSVIHTAGRSERNTPAQTAAQRTKPVNQATATLLSSRGIGGGSPEGRR